MPTHEGAGAERALDLAGVVGLDEHTETEAIGERVQIGEQRVVRDRGRDQQDRVGTDRARLVHLHLVDREVLAQHRQLGVLAGDLQIGDGTAEVRRVGEHREGGRAAVLVRLGRRGRIEVEGERTLRRRTTLDLGDHRDVAVGAAERTAERAGRRRLERARGAAGLGSAAAGAP